MQGRLFVFWSLVSLVDAKRVEAKSHQNSAASWSPWELSLKGLQCGALSASPYVGFEHHWPNCLASASTKGQELMKKGNCKLCDVSFTGSKPEAQMSMTSSACRSTVTCLASRSSGSWLAPKGVMERACFTEHGVVGTTYGLTDSAKSRNENPTMACLPCPSPCKECQAVKSKFTGTSRKFKCILKPEDVSAVKPEDLSAGMVSDKLDPAYKCGEVLKRECGFAKLGCNKKDYKTSCSFLDSYPNPGNATFASEPPEDHELMLKAGTDAGQLPLAYEYLTGTNA